MNTQATTILMRWRRGNLILKPVEVLHWHGEDEVKRIVVVWVGEAAGGGAEDGAGEREEAGEHVRQEGSGNTAARSTWG